MRLKRISKFTKSVTKGLLPTQQATICQVACGMLLCRSLILAEIYFYTETLFPYNLKRVWRFVSEWSKGQVEGQVNRLKLIKRQMYGRAKFDLLKARVLYSG